MDNLSTMHVQSLLQESAPTLSSFPMFPVYASRGLKPQANAGDVSEETYQLPRYHIIPNSAVYLYQAHTCAQSSRHTHIEYTEVGLGPGVHFLRGSRLDLLNPR